jgi:hypothetical protein
LHGKPDTEEDREHRPEAFFEKQAHTPLVCGREPPAGIARRRLVVEVHEEHPSSAMPRSTSRTSIRSRDLRPSPSAPDVIGSGAIVDSVAIRRDMTAQDEALVAGGVVIVQRRTLERAFSRMARCHTSYSPPDEQVRII